MTDEVFERVVPHSLDAERSVLGAILIREDALGSAVTLVSAGDFFRDAHQRIFRAMVALQERRVAIDLTTMKDELARAGNLDEIGGPGYLAGLVDGVPSSRHIEHYARIVSEKARLRRLIAAGNRLVGEAYVGEEDATAILERAEQVILGLADDQVQVGFEPMRAIAPRALTMLEEMRAAQGGMTGVPSGFADLDTITRGFQPGTLIVLGARPGVGKSSFASNVAQHAAARGYVVGLFSLEMPKEELFFRQVAATARLDSYRIQGGYLSDGEWNQVSRALNEVAEAPIHVDDAPAISMLTVRSRARRLKAEFGIGLLVIDYLQLMGTSGNHENRATAIAEITGALKGLAKELKIPVLVLSQLNRESVKGDKPRRPQLFDLKESGAIEQDADIVLFLHRAGEDESVTDLIVAKHRNGPIATVKLAWNERYTKFDNYIREPEANWLPVGDRE